MSQLLVVDDEASIREILRVLFTRAGHQVLVAESVQAAREALESQAIDLVLSDLRLGRESGLDVLKLARGLASSPEVIMLTAYGTPANAVEAMRRGAYDYIAKPFDNEELLLLVERALEKRRLTLENRQLKVSLEAGQNHYVGTSAAMKPVWALVDKVAAAARSTVLITGESGTGKEVVAKAIHFRGPRAAAPFVPVNCGAISEGLLESELFGHVKGAFSGATSNREGILVSAGQGTVLLDEVGETPMSTQVKLLRVLQERRVRPVGSSSEVPFEARILAATNRRLEDEVRAGRFREDLFFRLNVIAIELPPLRDRRSEIRPLAGFFLQRVAADIGRPGLTFAPETISLLESYSFSGNVRQLQNIVERAATLSDTDTLMPESLPPAVLGVAPQVPSEAIALPPRFSLEHHLDAQEREYLTAALKQASGVKVHAAELLGLSFRSFRYRLAKHGLSD
jgi:two-component system response regulator PilR (NtrC family)